MATQIDTDKLTIVCCGTIDQRYGEALYGVYHAVSGTKTLCGCRAHERETSGTIWFSERRSSYDPESISCGRCRRALGLQPLKESKVLL